MIQHIDPYRCQPPHGVRDTDKRNMLVRAMQEAGWQGRPLLVIANEDGYVAFTGSHRIAAAQRAGLRTVPAFVVDGSRWSVERWEEVEALRDDDDRMAYLKAKRLSRAAKLMAEEIAANA